MTADRRDNADEEINGRLVELFGFGPEAAEEKDTRLPNSWVKRAAGLIDDSGLCENLAQWRAEDKALKGPGGRPAIVGDRLVLILLAILAFEHRDLMVTNMARIVRKRLSPKARVLLGIPDDGASEAEWYHRLWRATHTLVDVIDPFPYPKGFSRKERHTKEEFKKLIDSRDPAAATRNQRRLDALTNTLLETTMQLIPRDARRKWKGNVCIDATPVPVYGKKGTSKHGLFTSIEPDAAWYVREGDHRDREAQPGTGKPVTKADWAWEATLGVMAANDPTGAHEFPYLVTGIGFGKPGHDISGMARALFGSIKDRNHPIGKAIGDRAYFPNSKPEDLQIPLREDGWELVFDYREDQLGVKENYAGALQVEGAWSCPSMPDALIEATTAHREGLIDDATYYRRIEQRRQYLLRPKERPNPDGAVPMMCPASGPNRTVACPLKRSSMVASATGRTALTVIQNPPSEPDRICTNKTSVTIPLAAGAKYSQSIQYGSLRWHQIYACGRNTMEGFNGYAKDQSREALAASGKRRLRGYAAQYLLITFLIVSANIRKIRKFVEERRKAGTDTVVRKPLPPRVRDKTKNYTEPLVIPGVDPPMAA